MVAGAERRLAGSWSRAAILAAVTLWAPALVPLLFGPLRECDHCVHTYLVCLPIVPGVLLPAFARLDGVWFFVAGALVTVVLFGGVTSVVRHLRRPSASAVQVAVVLAVLAESLGFANLLRA